MASAISIRWLGRSRLRKRFVPWNMHSCIKHQIRESPGKNGVTNPPPTALTCLAPKERNEGRNNNSSLTGAIEKPWHWPIIPSGCPDSSVGAAAFHDRVRDGNGWAHRALLHQNICMFTNK